MGKSADENPNGISANEGVIVSDSFFRFLILGIIMVFVGIAIIIVAAALSAGGSTGFGGVVFIGPFPIVFGAGQSASWLILIGIILAAVTVILFIVMNKRVKTSE
jgi:uncharacterized membrane protein